MKSLFTSTVSAFLLSTQFLWAGQVSRVDLAPIVHADAVLAVVGADGNEISYTPAQLEELPTYSLTTRTPWRAAPARFEGILLTDLLAENGISEVDAILVRAEDDYSTVIQQAVWESLDILIATRVDGKAHTLRARGPFQFVIDMEAHERSKYMSSTNMPWMANRIAADQ